MREMAEKVKPGVEVEGMHFVGVERPDALAFPCYLSASLLQQRVEVGLSVFLLHAVCTCME